MMKHTLKLIAAATSSVIILAGCGAVEDEPNTGAAMSAMGGAIAAPASIDQGIPDTDVLAEIEVEDTKSLVVAEDFNFDTAQEINVDFDLQSARGTDGNVSICTSYGKDTMGYDINYNSCTVRGVMSNGVFSHSMEVTNEFDKVIAVVWFQDESIPPVYREFSVADTGSDRSVKTADGKRVIVWR